MQGIVPAFTVLDDSIDNNPRAIQAANPGMPTWMSMYASNITSAPPNSPLLEFAMPDMVQDYPVPELNSPKPILPDSYGESIMHNGAVAKNNIRWNLPATPPSPMPTYNEIPYFNPPYGTPYPTNGYSQFDGDFAMNAGNSQFYGGPGVPAASWPGMLDARDSPSMPMTPTTLAIVAEKRYQQGLQDAKEHFAQTYQPTCHQSVNHSLNCPLCSNYLGGNKKLYQGAIIILSVIVLILLLLLYRKK
jgi:hypothetical protein